MPETNFSNIAMLFVTGAARGPNQSRPIPQQIRKYRPFINVLPIKKARERQNLRREPKISFYKENSKADRYGGPYTKRHRWAKYLNKHAVSEPTISLRSKLSTGSGKGAGKYDATSLGCPWSSGVTAEH